MAKTKETIGGNTYFVQRLHAINISDGTDASAPYLIGDDHQHGNTNNTADLRLRQRRRQVTDPYNGTGKHVVQFNALRENQRAALSLVNNTVYVAWASHGDNGPYHGWVVAWNVANVTTSGFQLTGVLNTSPNDGEAGHLGRRRRTGLRARRQRFYFMTGNGTGGAPTAECQRLPTDANYNEARRQGRRSIPPPAPTNQGPNGWGFKIVDYFIPYNVAALDGADSDFGSGGRSSSRLGGHPRPSDLMVAGGKDGRIYVLDRDDLGHYQLNRRQRAQRRPQRQRRRHAAVVDRRLAQHPGLLQRQSLRRQRLSASERRCLRHQVPPAHSSATSQTSDQRFGYLPGRAVVSANGTSNGIVWVMDRNLQRDSRL